MNTSDSRAAASVYLDNMAAYARSQGWQDHHVVAGTTITHTFMRDDDERKGDLMVKLNDRVIKTEATRNGTSWKIRVSVTFWSHNQVESVWEVFNTLRWTYLFGMDSKDLQGMLGGDHGAQLDG